MMLVLMAVAVASVLSIGFLEAQSTTQLVTRNVMRHEQARAIAQVGLQATMQMINADSSWRANKTNGTWVNNASVLGGTLSVEVNDGTFDSITGLISGDANLSNDPNDAFVITARGTYDGTTQVLRTIATVTATGGQRMVMFVANPNSLSAEEEARRAILATNGWNITVAADNSNASTIVGLAVNHSVFYVPITATFPQLGERLNSLGVGVVLENATYLSDMRITTAAPVNLTTSSIKVTGTTHYITEPFGPSNSVSITTSTQPMRTFSGLPSGVVSQATNNVSSGALPMLIVADANVALTTGFALGRRVVLPWGQSTFSINSLNNNGKTLLQRSLEWAAGSLQTSTNTGAAVTDYIQVRSSAVMDAYRSANGAYGGSNSLLKAEASTNSILSKKIFVDGSGVLTGNVKCGPGGVVSTVIQTAGSGQINGTRTALTATVSIPSVTLPADVPASGSAVTISTGTTTWTGNLRYSSLTISSSAIVNVSGTVNVVIDGTFQVRNSAQIRLNPGATLNIYCRNRMRVWDSAQVNANTAVPANCNVFFTSAQTLDMASSGVLHARVIGPLVTLSGKNSAQFYGTFQGRRIVLTNSAGFHQDLSASVVGGGAVSSQVYYDYSYRFIE